MSDTLNKNVVSKVVSIMVVGVGGQGTLLTSRILGNLLVSKGYDVKLSEVHGMAQRGGSVVTYVRFGEKVYSPVVSEQEADYIIAFEELEAYRWVSYLKKGGKMIVNRQSIDPMPVITGAAKYPTEIDNKLKDAGIDITVIDALEKAKEAGNARSLNVVLLGYLAKLMDFDKEEWLNAVKEEVPSKAVDINIKAFEFGYTL